MVRPAVKRAAVAHLQARMGLSERRACQNKGLKNGEQIVTEGIIKIRW